MISIILIHSIYNINFTDKLNNHFAHYDTSKPNQRLDSTDAITTKQTKETTDRNHTTYNNSIYQYTLFRLNSLFVKLTNTKVRHEKATLVRRLEFSFVRLSIGKYLLQSNNALDVLA